MLCDTINFLMTNKKSSDHDEKEMMERKLTQNLHNDVLLQGRFFNDD